VRLDPEHGHDHDLEEAFRGNVQIVRFSAEILQRTCAKSATFSARVAFLGRLATSLRGAGRSNMSRYQYALKPHRIDYGVEVPVADLKIEPQAQRMLSEPRAQKMADSLVLEAVGEICVSQRDNGEKYNTDGMHRTRAFELNGLPTIRAEVHHGLTLEEEATLFLVRNREASKPGPLDEYKIGLTAKLPMFIDTETTLQKHNLRMGSTSAQTIGAVQGVLKITERYGPDVLDRVLGIAEKAWGRTDATWDGMLLGGLGKLLGQHEQVDGNDAFVEKLAKKPAHRWVADVHAVASSGGLHNSGTGSRVVTAYAMFVREWNKGRRQDRIKVRA
jgi:hypothetical protein